MKIRKIGRWLMGLGLLVALPFAGGCVQENNAADSPPVVVVTNNATAAGSTSKAPAKTDAATSIADTNLAMAAEDTGLADTNEPSIDIANAPYKAISAPKPTPTTVRTNGPVGELVKMANAGVEEEILMTYITNSTSVFSLSADEIIYLNDLGLSSTLVTAVLQHDQALKGAAANNLQLAGATPPPTNEAAQPAPESVAPQSTAPPPAPETAQAAPPQTQAPQSQPTYQTFYDSLSPYGNWVYIEGYGRVWQPSVVVVNPTWSPYVNNGSWLYTDAGWYWNSDYSWGWAPFHYGRWFRHYRLGWCWYPDTYWGPSWVTWRYTDGYCGWAPLPPGAWYRPGFGITWWGHNVGLSFSFGLGYNCFSFVSWNHFHGHNLHHYMAPYGQRANLYHSSVVATRYEGNRRFAANHGLPVERVTAATGVPVQRVAIRETSNMAGRGMRNERLSSDGRSVTVYRPRLPESSNRTMPERTIRTASSGSSGAATASTGIGANRFAQSARPESAVKPATEPKTWERPVPATRREVRPVTTVASVNRTTTSNPVIERQTTATAPASSSIERSGGIINRSPSTVPQNRSEPVSRFGNSASVPSGTIGSRPADNGTMAPTTRAPATQSAPTTTARNSTTATTPPGSAQRNYGTTIPSSQNPWQRGNVTTPAQSAPVARPASPQTPQNVAPQQRTYTAPPTVQRPTSSSSPVYTAPTRTPEVSRFSQSPVTPAPSQQRSYQAPVTPSYQAPVRAETPRFSTAPTYSAPAQTRSYSAPAPSYSAPAPSRSYSAPAQSAPAPSYSAPAQRSSPPPSTDRSSGGNDRGSSRGSRF